MTEVIWRRCEWWWWWWWLGGAFVHVFPYFNALVARVSYWLVNCAGRTVRIFGNRFTCSYLTRKPEHYFSARTPFSTVDEVTSSFFDSIVVYAIYGDSRRGLHRRIVVRFFPFRSSFVIFYLFFFFFLGRRVRQRTNNTDIYVQV